MPHLDQPMWTGLLSCTRLACYLSQPQCFCFDLCQSIMRTFQHLRFHMTALVCQCYLIAIQIPHPPTRSLHHHRKDCQQAKKQSCQCHRVDRQLRGIKFLAHLLIFHLP